MRIAGQSAAMLAALAMMIITLGVASAADAPRAPGINDPRIEQDAAISRDKRYRLVGAAVPASPETDTVKGTLAAGKYRLQGSVVGIEIDPVAHRESKAASRAKRVDILDVLAQWGACPLQSDCAADIDLDGFVGPQDLIAAIEADRE